MKVSYAELKAEFKRVLLSRNMREDIAEECATVFADTTQAGAYSHGVLSNNLKTVILFRKPFRPKSYPWAPSNNGTHIRQSATSRRKK